MMDKALQAFALEKRMERIFGARCDLLFLRRPDSGASYIEIK
jgi:hypothetical protein